MKKLDKLEVYKTINVLILFFVILFFLRENKLFLVIAIVLLAADLIYPKLNQYIAIYWLAFAEFLGKVNSKIILTFIFFVLLTPISILYRAFNKAEVVKFKTNNNNSYFEDTNIVYKKDTFLKSW